MLELKNISKSFGDKVILNNLNLEVKDGEILCIVGQSGNGRCCLPSYDSSFNLYFKKIRTILQLLEIRRLAYVRVKEY